MEVKLYDFGTVLSTRTLGKKVRCSILPVLKSGEKVIFDLQEVRTLSNSFADECFGKLLLDFDFAQIKGLTSFRNTEKMNSTIILMAFKQRLHQLQNID